MGGKIQKILINVLLTLAVMCSVMCFLILLEKYEINHKKSRATDYELKASEYKALTAQGKNVYICRCGIDKNQHCTNCKGCSKNEYVLFVEHSTDYKAEADADFAELKAIIEAQNAQ